jgi:hypothetical protein
MARSSIKFLPNYPARFFPNRLAWMSDLFRITATNLPKANQKASKKNPAGQTGAKPKKSA